MRYWAYLGAKVAVAGGLLYGLLLYIGYLWRGTPSAHQDPLAPLSNGFGRLLFNLTLMGWFLLAAGTLSLIVWDQRRRCRTCLRRLRMPVQIGSWSRMLLLGRPRIEYICPYGHGTLIEEELQISGRTNAEWTPQSGDMWEELCSSVREDDDKHK
jgi:hypothetical protein